ncbi:unnamed protein product [Urochloa decumbens]|uniref:Uncharacterized protein n=1 Tax=Urochloa decumbens TaxID=240449 RepID=A0ABC9DW22_9POAL
MTPRLRILNITHVLPDRSLAAAYSPPPPPPLPDDGLVELSFMEALFVDRAMPMRRLFFYEGPGVPPFPSLNGSLRSSLAAALAVFPPLSGKLAHRPSSGGGVDVVVDCSPAAVSPGVRFVEAEYGGGIADMRRVASGSDGGDTEALMELGPELDATQLPAPVLTVQVTRPAVGAGGGGGRAVGSPPSRDVADLAPPAFDRTPLRYPEADELACKILRTVAPALPVIRSSEEPDTPPSTYLAVSSLIWTSIARAKSGDDLAGDGDAYFLVAVDFRRRLGPPIDDRYFGDCVVPCVARAVVHDLRGDIGLACAAAAIRDAIRAQPEDPVRAMEAWLEALREVVPCSCSCRERFRFTGSSNRFMAYEMDFGWGKPSKVELVLLLGADDGGVQVTATLRPEHMDAFASNLARFSRSGNDGYPNC